MVSMSTQPTLTLFQENTQAFSLNQSHSSSLSTHSQLIHLARMWLADCQPQPCRVWVAKACPAKKITSFNDTNAQMPLPGTHPTSLGLE